MNGVRDNDGATGPISKADAVAVAKACYFGTPTGVHQNACCLEIAMNDSECMTVGNSFKCLSKNAAQAQRVGVPIGYE